MILLSKLQQMLMGCVDPVIFIKYNENIIFWADQTDVLAQTKTLVKAV